MDRVHRAPKTQKAATSEWSATAQTCRTGGRLPFEQIYGLEFATDGASITTPSAGDRTAKISMGRDHFPCTARGLLQRDPLWRSLRVLKDLGGLNVSRPHPDAPILQLFVTQKWAMLWGHS